jgi:predicted nucleotidyltransferase component of viral defense system
MLNKQKHQLIMTRILKDIYGDAEISSFLGFKGGTAAYFFYNLPRFSVDLDFDLINDSGDLNGIKDLLFHRIEAILKKYGTLKEKHIKRWTIFFLLSYDDDDHNIKIEISTRKHNNQYEIKEYLGISMLAARKETLFANKLVALIGRKQIAMRDVYDIYFFAQNNWSINEKIILFWTKKNLKSYLGECVKKIEKINDKVILQGLGEVLEEKEKVWARNNLKKETIFLLKNYQKTLNS